MMRKLKGLNLSLNHLSGFVPDEFYSMSTLVQIDFSSQTSWDGISHCMLSDGTFYHVASAFPEFRTSRCHS